MINFNNKPILMIHEFCKEYLSLPLQNYILTFDDGLYTQYLFLKQLLKLDTPLIFSISSNIICSDKTIQSDEFIKCNNAHLKAFNYNNFENYMTWSQVNEILNSKNCFISGHSSSHIDISKLKSLNEKVLFIKEDTEKMLISFKYNLNFTPDIFCFPYNYNYTIYKAILRFNYNFKYFLGPERINILEIL